MPDQQPGFERQTRPEPGTSFGWVQWKGTNVCMDVHCEKCGALSHIDAEFAYYIRCPGCGQIWSVSGFVEFIPLEGVEIERLVESSGLIVDAE